MNAITPETDGSPLHARFEGPIVMIGFGSIGKGNLAADRAPHRLRPLEIRRHRAR